MKIIKTASGKQQIKISKTEWTSIGKKAGWMKKAQVAIGGKKVDLKSIEIDGIDRRDYPDFCDAYISSATFEDGTPLSDEEVTSLDSESSGLVNEMIHENQLWH